MKQKLLQYVVRMLEEDTLEQPKRKYEKRGVPVYYMGRLQGYVPKYVATPA